MLTPTGVTISEYWSAIKAGNPTHVKMEFTEQDVTLTDEDIFISAGVEVEDIFNGDTDLCFGRAVMKAINTQVILSDKVRYIGWTDEFVLSFGVEIGGTTHWVAVGKFTGERPNNLSSADIISFTAYDRMKKFDILIDDYMDSLTYPITLQGFYEGLCTFVGVEYAAGDQLANAYARQYTLGELDLKGYLCRDVLAWIAEACGCYAKITADGKCKLAWFSNNSTYTVTANEEFRVEHADLYSGMIWNEFDLLKWDEADLLTWDEVCGYYKNSYGIKEVKLRQNDVDIDLDYPQAEEKNVYLIENNPFLTINDPVSDTTTYIKPIYDRLDAFGGQLPMQTECIGNWLVEAGDIISIQVADEVIESPIFVRTLVWKGSINDSYETTGNKDRVISTADSRERLVTTKLIKLYAMDHFYQTRSGIEIKPEGIEIDSSKYLKIKSGGSIDIKAGSTLSIDSGNFGIDSSGNVSLKGNVEISSGKNMAIKSGGTLSIDSGNFSIDSSGNVALKGGVEITSGKDMKIKSGGNLKIESGGSISIKSGSTLSIDSGNFGIDSSGNVSLKGNVEISSGKNMAIKSGGTLSIDSGNFSIDSSGNVALKGGVEITSGKYMNVKSGGNLKVESGGNIDINGTGTLKLSGATVEIKSGSTFEVDSTNFSISSDDKRMVCGNWSFGTLGASLELTDGFELRIAGNNAYIASDIAVSTYVYRNSWTDHPTWWSWGYGICASLIDNGTIIERGTIGFKYTTNQGSPGWAFSRIETYSADVKYILGEYAKEFDAIYVNNIKKGYHADYLNIQDFIIRGGRLYYDGALNPDGSIGIADHKFEYGYINTIYYGSLIQNSSKEIKHDIHPLPSVGEKLDQLKPVTFVYDDDPNENQRMGLIYEDTVDVMPEVCTKDEGNKAINYVELIPALLKEVQELRARVKELEEREEN